jgi:hypothetical protein
MRKIILASVLIATFISCKSKTESCVEGLMDEEGYTYEEACDECEQARIDSEVRFD